MVVTRRQAAAQQGNEGSSPTNGSTGMNAVIPNGSSSANGKQQQQFASSSSPTSASSSKKPDKRDTPTWVYITLVAFAVTTVVSFPVPLIAHGEPTLKHVFFYGWITALCTGIGALPFLFLPDVADFWVGISNGEYESFSLGEMR